MKNARAIRVIAMVLMSAGGALSAPESSRLRELVAANFPEGNVYIGGTTGYRFLDTQDERILREEFSYITPDNDFKQSLIHPEPGVWKWEIPDSWIKIAERDNQLIRIHGPICPQVSKWAYADERTAEELLTNLREYMTALCKRYDGHPNVRWMDVVNETVNMVPGNGWNGPRPGIAKYENPWPKVGMITNIPPEYAALQDGVPRYIVEAFKIANEHAPNTKQIINQHGSMRDFVWDRIRDLVPYLRKEHGLRVDGIGWQGHILYFKDKEWGMDSANIKYLGELIDWAHENDLDFHCTENNIHDYPEGAEPKDDYAEVYENILSTILSKRKGGVVSWSVWYLRDQEHWRGKGRRLNCLWDEDANPNEAYDRVQNLLMYPPKAD